MTSQQPAETPRDGRRYEIVAGRLLITGAQPPAHHAAVVGLMVHLKTNCPPDLMVAVGSLAFRPTPTTTLRPDVLVCPRDYTGVHPPLLAVEVVSASTRTTDVVLKRALYETHQVPSGSSTPPTKNSPSSPSPPPATPAKQSSKPKKPSTPPNRSPSP